MLNILSQFPSMTDLVSAIPVIFSLILIEGLLSVDNAMAIAAMASVLPHNDQKKALRYGIIGAYVFRGLCMAFVAWIAGNIWLKLIGAAYLLYLMASNLVKTEQEEQDEINHVHKSLIATIFAIEVMDLSLSLDNIVAAVALDSRLWVVCTGVFIGILVLRFVAGYCIRLIEKFPILQKTAFLLIGFVGVTLVVEIIGKYLHLHTEITSGEKFAGIIMITSLSLLYGHTTMGRKLIHPVVYCGYPVLCVLNTVLGWIMMPFAMLINGGKWVVKFAMVGI